MDPIRLEMFQLAVGYWYTKALYCAAQAGVADRLAAGPEHVDRLAEAAGVDSENLYRVLRALTGAGIFAETAPRVIGLTPRAEYLREDHPESIKHYVLMVGGDLFEVWCDLDHAVRTGESAVTKRFGRDFFAELGSDLQKSQVFDRAMQEIHLGETDLVLRTYDFSRHSRVLDVGGGNGSTLRGILAAHPHLRGAVFDLPQVVESARAALEADAGLADRIELLPGSFFEEVTGEADCIVLRHVIHDWDDERAATILRNSSRALSDGGRLLIVEKVVTDAPAAGFVKLLDLNMMAIGGKERTEAQYRALLAQAGLRIRQVHATPGPTDVIEAGN